MTGTAACKVSFPLPAESCLPHRPPLLLLDSVDGVNEDGAWGTLTLRPDNPFLNNGVLERIALAEMLAQCFAAFGAVEAQGAEAAQPAIGYLAALRDVRVLGDARVDDVLSVSVRRIASMGGITVMEGEVRCYPRVLATGQCKVFVAEAGA